MVYATSSVSCIVISCEQKGAAAQSRSLGEQTIKQSLCFRTILASIESGKYSSAQVNQRCITLVTMTAESLLTTVEGIFPSGGR